jgi:hypothetical protein
MTAVIERYTRNKASEWDALVNNSAQGTLFHTWNWLEIIERHTRSILYPLVVKNEDVPLGIFPLFFQKKGVLKMVFSPPPRTSVFYMGPIVINYETLRQDKRENNYFEIQKLIDEYITTELDADYVSISLPPGLPDPRPFSWSNYSVTPLYDYVINLNNGADFLFQTLDKKRRQDINRIHRKGIKVEIGSKKEYELILDLMEERYKQQAKIVNVPKDYLLDIYDAFSEYLTIFYATYEGEVITGLIDLHYKDSIYSWIGNLKPVKYIAPSPSDLINWEAVKYGCEQGFKSYVLLSAAGNKRLYAYNAAKFNPQLSIRFSVKRSSFTAGMIEKGYVSIIKPLIRRSLSLKNTTRGNSR